MNQFIIAIIRTIVPIVVGAVFAWLLSLGIPLPEDVKTEVTAGLTVLLSSLYYIGVAWLARKWAWFGWLLGVARNPVYEPKDVAKHVAQ